MVHRFQHELERNGEPLAVIVRADVYRDGNAPGSLSCEPATYCDILSVRTMGGANVETYKHEDDVIREVAVSIAKDSR